MDAIKATWTNGQIIPLEPVDWPDGSALLVEKATEPKLGLSEEEWKDDAESIAAWIKAVHNIQPMEWAEGEREDYERYREKVRQLNLEAVRKQMEEMSHGDTP